MVKAMMIRVLAAVICAQLCGMFTLRAWGAGEEFAIEEEPVMGPPFGSQSLPSIASNGTDVFVAWQEQTDSTQSLYHAIRGARIGVDGSISKPYSILDLTGGRRTPKVFSNGHDYLVVWLFRGIIHIKQVPFDGDFAQAQTLEIPAGTSDFLVASDGKGYAIVWSDGFGVAGAIIKNENGILTSSRLSLPEERPSDLTGVENISLTSNGETYFIAYHESYHRGDSNTRTFGIILDGQNPALNSGLLLLHERRRTNNLALHFSDAAVSANGDYILLFQNKGDEAFAVPVRRDGSIGLVNSLQIEGLSTTSTFRIIRSGARQLLMLGAYVQGEAILRALELDSAGLPAGQLRVIATLQGVIPLQWDFTALGETVWVAWTSLEPGTGYDVNVNRYSFGQPAGPRLQPAKAPNSHVQPVVASNGSEYLTVWVDDRNNLTTGLDLYGARVDRSGRRMDEAAFPISTAPGLQQSPVITALGTNFIVSWEDFRRGASIRDARESDIYAARVTGAGQVLDPQGIRVSSKNAANTMPSIASNGEVSLVAWQQREESDEENIHAARISASGAVLDPGGIPVETLPGRQGTAAVASDGTNFLSVFLSQGILASARISPEGAVLDAPARIYEQYASVRPLRVVFNGTDYVACLGLKRSVVHAEIRALFIGSDGNLRFAAPAPLLAHTTDDVEIAAYGEDFETGRVIFAIDGVDYNGLPRDPVRASAGLLGSDGSAIGSILIGERELTAPMAVAYGSAGDFLFVRTSYTSGYRRLLGRLVSTFQPIKIESGRAQVRWKATPGKTYQIDAASDLSNPVWTLFETRTASGSIESVEDASDPAGVAQKYYRITERP